MSHAFRPDVPNNSQALSLTTSSSTTALNIPQSPPPRMTLRLFNAGTVVVFVAIGDSDITTASSAGLAIAPGRTEGIEIFCPRQTHIAAIAASGTPTLHVTVGQGCVQS